MALRIDSITARPLSVPLLDPFTIASGRIETTRAALVEVTLVDEATGARAVGLGEAAALPPVTHEDQPDLIDAARAFAARVFDVQEWLATRIDQLPSVAPLDARVAVQDPCHLRHVQKVHQATRTVLRPFVRELVELDDDGMCCGSGGSYSITNRSLSQQVRARKVQTIDAVHADIVASANPGCSLNLAAAGVPARHPMCIIDEALSTTTLR